MKINKTIQNELDNLPTEIKNKYNIRINNKKDALVFEFINNSGYVHIDFDRSFKITSDKATINIKNKKMFMSVWKNNYIWHLTVY